MICQRKWKQCHPQLAPLWFPHTIPCHQALYTIMIGPLHEHSFIRWRCWQQLVSRNMKYLCIKIMLKGWSAESFSVHKELFKDKNTVNLIYFLSFQCHCYSILRQERRLKYLLDKQWTQIKKKTYEYFPRQMTQRSNSIYEFKYESS